MNRIHKYTDGFMKLLTDRMPRKVVISTFVLAGTLVLTLILVPVLGGLHSDTLDNNTQLKGAIKTLTDNLKKAKDDHQFLVDNHEKFDDLMHSDRLVPHTRSVAMAQMQKLALQRGLTTLSYNFASTDNGAATETVTGGYRLQAEKVNLKVGSALDTQVFDFIIDLNESFPGSAIVQEVKLERAPELSTEALNHVSSGDESGLVKGEMTLAWRTAQAQDKDDKSKGRRK